MMKMKYECPRESPCGGQNHMCSGYAFFDGQTESYHPDIKGTKNHPNTRCPYSTILSEMFRADDKIAKGEISDFVDMVFVGGNSNE